jgi:hypothetical protein
MTTETEIEVLAAARTLALDVAHRQAVAERVAAYQRDVREDPDHPGYEDWRDYGGEA